MDREKTLDELCKKILSKSDCSNEHYNNASKGILLYDMKMCQKISLIILFNMRDTEFTDGNITPKSIKLRFRVSEEIRHKMPISLKVRYEFTSTLNNLNDENFNRVIETIEPHVLVNN